jgi:hypothetical protein
VTKPPRPRFPSLCQLVRIVCCSLFLSSLAASSYICICGRARTRWVYIPRCAKHPPPVILRKVSVPVGLLAESPSTAPIPFVGLCRCNLAPRLLLRPVGGRGLGTAFWYPPYCCAGTHDNQPTFRPRRHPGTPLGYPRPHRYTAPCI